MRRLRSTAAAVVVLGAGVLLAACGSSMPSDEDAFAGCDRELLRDFVLERDIASEPFTTETGVLEVAVVWRDENPGALLGTVSRPVFIIDEDAEPDVTIDDVNGFRSTNDRRFRNDTISVTLGTYRLYSPSNVDVSLSEVRCS